MKKIKLLTPILGLTAISSVILPLASCSCKQQDTESVIPSDAFEIKDVTLKGFKDGFDYKNYTKLVVPSNVKVIEENAFKNLFTSTTKVNTIVIPSNVETIRKGAFTNNNGITTYDFSSFGVDAIHALSVESGAFALEENNIYSYVQMNENLTDIQKETLKNKLIGGGVPVWCFVKPTTGNVELSSTTPKEQNANAGEAVTKFEVKGEYSKGLEYRAFLTKLDASTGVDLDYEPTVTISEDYKTVSVNTEMSAISGHTFSNEDYVTYKITLVCYTVGGTESEPTYTAKWAETLDTFKLTYHNVLESITIANTPTKLSYKAGETFEPDGLQITANFSNGQTPTLDWDGTNVYTSLDAHTFSIEDVQSSATLKAIAYYKYEDTIKNVDFSVNMLESYAALVAEPKKTEYAVGDTYSKDDVKVTAAYAVPGQQTYGTDVLTSDQFTATSDIPLDTAFTADQVGSHNVTVSYTVDNVTKTDVYSIQIKESTSQVTVTLVNNDLTETTSEVKVNKGGTMTKPTDPTRTDGPEFIGWYTELPDEYSCWDEDKKVDFTTKTFDSDTTLYARWGNEFCNRGWTNQITAINTFESKSTPTLNDASALILELTGYEVMPTWEISVQRFLQDVLVGVVGTIKINGQYHYIKCIDAMHDDLADGSGKATLTFQLFTLLSDSEGSKISSKWDASNNYDYTNSILRANLTNGGAGTKTLKNPVLTSLPSELQTGIKSVNKKVATYDTGSSAYVVSSTGYDDKLFPLTCTEYAYSIQHAMTEGSAYKYWTDYNTDDDRILSDANGTTGWYLLASPYARDAEYNAYMWNINPYGAITSTAFKVDQQIGGVAFAFAI